MTFFVPADRTGICGKSTVHESKLVQDQVQVACVVITWSRKLFHEISSIWAKAMS